MKIKSSVGERLSYDFVIVFLVLIALVIVLPLMNIVAISFSSKEMVSRRLVTFWPLEPTLASWKYILEKNDMWRSFALTAFITVTGVILTLFFSSLFAYSLSKKELHIAKYINILLVFTIIFKAPMVPYFIVLKSYGLYDNILVLILPTLMSGFNIFIMQTFFREIPVELEESSFLEGCNRYQTLFKIVLPISKPLLATIAIFTAVDYWNQFYHPILFINNPNLFPLQVKLRELMNNMDVALEQTSFHTGAASMMFNSRTLQMTAVIFVTLPIVLVYPFLQKYFIKGAMLGSIKE